MSHPASWYAIANQIDSFEPPVINSPTPGSSFDYESQPTELQVTVRGNAAAYAIALQETSTAQLGIAQNNSATRFPLPSLAAGTHSLQVHATASLSLCGLHHSNTQTTPLSLTVTKSTPTLTITITPSTIVSPGTETHATCTSSTPQATPQLRRDGTPVTNPDVAALPLGTYDYTCSAAETQNYTSAVATPVTLIADTRTPTTTTVTINGVSADATITYGETAALAATTSAGSLTLYLNGTPVTNPTTLTPAAGVYNVTSINPGDADHFASSATHWLTVNKATPTLTLTATPATTVTYGTETTVSCTASTPQVTPALTRDSAAVTDPEVRTLAGGSYAYSCTSAATQNYTPATAIPLTLTVNRATPSLTLTINGVDADATTETGVPATITATLSVTGSIRITEDGTEIANGAAPQTTVRTPAGGTHNYTATYAGNTNYTPTTASHLLTVRDLTPPVVSGLTWTYANGSMGTAGAITWTTSEPANTTVYYGNTSGTYTNTLANSTSSAAHNQSLSNLDANTTYYYIINSCDSSGNCANTTENTFTTPAPFERVQIAGKYVSALKSLGGVLYLGTDNGVGGLGGIYTTVDGSTLSWVTNVSDRRIQTFGVLDGKLYAGTGSTYGQLLRRNTDGTWTNLVNFTEEKQVEAIAEYYYAPDGVTYRYLGMYNGSTGTKARVYYNPDTWGTDAVWDIYETWDARRITSFVVLGDQIYAGLESTGFGDTECIRGYRVGCTPYRIADPRGNGRANFVKHDETHVIGAYSYLQFVGQNTSNMNSWQDTLTFASAPSSVTLGKAMAKEYLATSTGAGGYDVYQSGDGGATWKKIYSALGAMPKVEEHGGKVYVGTSNAGGTQGYLLRST